MERRILSLLGAVCLLAAPPAGAQAPIAAIASGGPAAEAQDIETLSVTRYDDTGEEGTLRHAIETSNAAPGRYRIEIASPPGEAAHIVLASPLPAVKGPVTITGTAWAEDGRFAILDGSGYLDRDLRSCPGATEGQFGTNVRTSSHPGLRIEDTRGVAISGLEVRNFCIGILVMRSANNVIADNRITRNIGGAGVMITGDDGKGGSTSDTALDNKVLRNTFLENGDALELTRGAAFNLIAENVFDAGEDNLEPSQGIEILWGNDNTVVQNRFVNYTDGLQLNWGARNYIAANLMEGNAIGVSVTGQGNMISGNEIRGNGIGIAVRPEAKVAANRLSRNILTDNGQKILRCSAGGSCAEDLPRGNIVFGVPGLEHVDYVGSRGMGVVQDPATAPRICVSGDQSGCQQPPQFGLLPPELTGATVGPDGLAVSGTANGPASRRLAVEVFAGPPGTADAARYLGTISARSGDDGKAVIEGMVDAPPAGWAVSATVTTPDGATSELSAPRDAAG